MNISVFERFSQKTEDIHIDEMLLRIKEGHYQEKIRLLRENRDTEQYGAIKKQLPAFTPSGTFENGRKASLIAEYSGLVVLDIDHITVAKIAEIKDMVQYIPYTYACFISPGGRGAKILVRVGTAIEDHEAVFTAVRELYTRKLGVEIDAGKDICRLCFVSYDPTIYLHGAAEPFLFSNQKTPILKVYSVFDQCIAKTERKYRFVEGERNKFVFYLACNCNRAGIPHMEALTLIMTNYGYDTQEVEKTVYSAYAPGRAAERPTYSAKNGPYDKHRSELSYLERVEAYLQARYQFRYNVITNRTEYTKGSMEAYRPLYDHDEKSLIRELQHAGFNISMQRLRIITESDFAEKYDPFKAYFDALPDWDQQRDYITELAHTVTIAESNLWKICLKKWIVAMVGGLLNEKIINHTAIIFSGAQGLGKTTWLNRLVPESLQAYRYSGTINPTQRDSQIQLAECMLINMDELENMNRKDIGSLKHLMTMEYIRLRRAYAHYNETLFRRASFVGSVNTTQFLTDTTGSRRFLCFEVQAINYQHQVPIHMVYAQAKYLLKTDFRFYFSPVEIVQINQHNEKYQFRYPEEEMLLVYYRKPNRGEDPIFLTASQIGVKLSQMAGLRLDAGSTMKIGKALSKHGFDTRKRKGSKVYSVIEKDPEGCISVFRVKG